MQIATLKAELYPARLWQTAQKTDFGVMAFCGGAFERKMWSEKGTTVKTSNCGAEQVLETGEMCVRLRGPIICRSDQGPQAGAGGSAALFTVAMAEQGWWWSLVSQDQSRVSGCSWGRSTPCLSTYP